MVGYDKYEATPPRGLIFSYSSKVKGVETFRKWFKPEENCTKNHPALICCLDQGFVKFKNAEVCQKINNPQSGYIIPLNNGENQEIYFAEDQRYYVKDGNSYPVKRFKDWYIPIDRSKVLLHFLFHLTELIKKQLNPNIRFLKYYANQSMNLHIKID